VGEIRLHVALEPHRFCHRFVACVNLNRRLLVYSFPAAAGPALVQVPVLGIAALFLEHQLHTFTLVLPVARLFDMFGDYSIETASRHPSSFAAQEDLDIYSLDSNRPVSPRDTRTSAPSTDISVAQLSIYLDRQTLDSAPVDEDQWDPLGSSRADSDYFSMSSRSWSTPLSPLACRRRLQRQNNIRLQCDPSYLRNISRLVERMITSKDQCEISESLPTTPDPIDEDHESISSGQSSPRSISSASSANSSSRAPSWGLPPKETLHSRRSREALSLRPTTSHGNRVGKRSHRRD